MAIVKRDANGNKTEMIWFIDSVEAHYNATFAVTHIYSYVSMGGAVARVDRVADTQTNIEYEFQGLGAGALAAVDQPTGTVNATLSYSPFGEIVEATDGGGAEGFGAHRYRWNDKYVDELSELAYYGARFYDRASMTWTQGDPLYRFAPDARWTAPRRGNLYTFSLNNALRYVDPDGRDVWTKAEGPHSGRGQNQKGLKAAWVKELGGWAHGGIEMDAALAATEAALDAAQEGVPVTCVGPPGDCAHAHWNDSPTSMKDAVLSNGGQFADAPNDMWPTWDEPSLGSKIWKGAKTGIKVIGFGIVSYYFPLWALAGGLSQAQNHNDTVLPIVGWAAGQMGAPSASVGAAEATLDQYVGREAADTVREVLKGRVSAGSLTGGQAYRAAMFYRQQAANIMLGKAGYVYQLEASAYNIARAQLLEGTRASLSPTLPEFIANGMR